jgi:hypothetical protein
LVSSAARERQDDGDAKLNQPARSRAAVPELQHTGITGMHQHHLVLSICDFEGCCAGCPPDMTDRYNAMLTGHFRD